MADADDHAPTSNSDRSRTDSSRNDRTPPPGGPTLAASGRRLDRHRLVRAGVFSWSIVGLCAVVVVVVYLLGMFKLVVVPLVIALFPAALLSPLSSRLRDRGLPRFTAAAVVLVGFLVGLFGLLGVLFWLIADELGGVIETVQVAYTDVTEWVQERFGWNLPNIEELLANVQDWAMGLDVGSTASSVAFTTVEVLSGLLLGLIALFFYLKDGDRMVGVMLQLTPERLRDDVAEVLRRVWSTLGGYFRGQLIVAAADAVLIGIGLLVLGVPLALPLAVLVFFGGLFPIVGAFTAGAVAVLVALADGGIGIALAVLVLNVVVQQVEGNFLEPVIVGRATSLHPLVILASLTAGAVTLGILGALLAVPLTACVVRAASYVLERDPELDIDHDGDLPKLEDHVPDEATAAEAAA